MTLVPTILRSCGLTALLAAVLIVLPGCGGGEAEPTAQAGPRANGGPREQRELPPAPVAVTEVTVGPIASYYGATASLEAVTDIEVLARVDGVVGELRAEEGDLVDEGEVLLVLDNPALTYRLEQATARTAQLEAAYQRLKQMRAEDLASDEELETARANYDDARAAEGLARLDVEYTRVEAPFAGVVTERLVAPGQTVATSTALYRLADVTPLWARVHVPSREFRQLELDQTVELVLDSDGRVLQGTIALISPVIDPTSGTIKVTVELPDYPAGTRPGDFAEVRIVTELRPEAVLVPRVAVVNEKGESLLFVVGDENKAERRVVEVGFTDRDLAQILSGVRVGERVVVKGQRSLKPGQSLKILDGPGAEPAEAPHPRGERERSA